MGFMKKVSIYSVLCRSGDIYCDLTLHHTTLLPPSTQIVLCYKDEIITLCVIKIDD